MQKMKKIFCGLTTLSICIALIGCGSSSSTAGNDTATQTDADATEAVSKKDFDGSSYSDMGDGTFGIINESGSTLESADVVVYVGNPKTDYIQIGYESYDFNGGALTYIYIDGMLNTKEQLGESQGTLELAKEALEEGPHLVEAVQYEGDDSTAAVKTYKSAEYSVKLK